MKNRPNQCKSLCHEVALEFFATKALDPPHWTLNSYFGEFCTIWVHLGPFGCLTKIGAKRGEPVQKFVPRSCIGIFRNERTRSTPLDPTLTFWCVRMIWVHSGLFGSLIKLGAKRAELVQKFVPRSRVRIFPINTPDPPHWALNSCFGVFRTIGCIRGHLVALLNSVQNGPN